MTNYLKFYSEVPLGGPPIGGSGNFTDLINYACDYYPLNQNLCHQLMTDWSRSPNLVSSRCQPTADNKILSCLSAEKIMVSCWELFVKTVQPHEVQSSWLRDCIGMSIAVPFIGFTPQLIVFYMAFMQTHFGQKFFILTPLMYFVHICIFLSFIFLMGDMFGSVWI